MLTETKLGIAAVGTGLTGFGVYETPHLGGIFLQNEVLVHDIGFGLMALTLLLAAGAAYKRLPLETQNEQNGLLIKPKRSDSLAEIARMRKRPRRIRPLF